jgi:hypothetical protein
MSSNDHRYGLFLQDAGRFLWKAFFADPDEAKRQAQTLADTEGCECFVFDLSHATEVLRAFPLNVLKPTLITKNPSSSLQS